MLGIAQKIVQPKDVAEFRRKTNVRIQRRKGQLRPASKPPEQLCFGVPSLPSDSMKEIMTNGYGNAAAEQLRLKYQQELRHRSAPKPRNSSLPTVRSRTPQLTKTPFKMKKFQEVPARVRSHRE